MTFLQFSGEHFFLNVNIYKIDMHLMINGILQLYLAALFLVVQKTMVHLTIDGFLTSMKSLDCNWFLNSL